VLQKHSDCDDLGHPSMNDRITQERGHDFASVTLLLDQLQRIASKSGAYQDANLRYDLTITLVRALADSTLPMCGFVACAAALKNRLSRAQSDSSARAADDTKRRVCESLGRFQRLTPRINGVLRILQVAAEHNERVKIDAVASSLGIDSRYLGQLVEDGSGFKVTEWRTAFLIRPSISAVLTTDEDIKQIAGSLPAFKTLSQFDHEFHRFLGLSPVRLRRLYRGVQP
jgi:AraC-like DNA-binding protein